MCKYGRVLHIPRTTLDRKMSDPPHFKALKPELPTGCSKNQQIVKLAPNGAIVPFGTLATSGR